MAIYWNSEGVRQLKSSKGRTIRSDEQVKPFPKAAIWVFGILFGGMALALMAIGLQEAAADKEYRDALAEAKVVGFKTEVSELSRTVAIEDNAAIELVPLMAQKVKFQELEKYLRGESSEALAVEELKSLDERASQIELASQMPEWYIDKFSGKNRMDNILFPEYSQFKTWVKFFTYRAKIRASKGDLDGAESDLLTGARLSNLLRKEQTLIGGLVMVACQAIVRVSAAELAINSGGKAEETEIARRTIRSFKTADPSGILSAELLFIQDWVNHFEEYRKHYVADTSLSPLHHLPINPKRVGAPILRSYIAGRKGFETVLDDPVGSKVSFSRAVVQSGSLWPPEQYWADQMGGMFFESAGYSLTRSKIMNALALAGMEILEFKRLNGRVPKTLSELGAKADLRDLWSAGEFLYRVDPKGFVVYSVGQNEKDDGGVVAPNGASKDIMFQTIDPKKPALTGS